MILKKIAGSLVAFLIFSSMGLNAQNLTVVEKGGNSTPIAITSIRSLTFPSGNLNINLKVGTPLSVSLSKVSSVHLFTITDPGVITDVELPTQPAAGKLHLYPNPASDFVTINFASNVDSDIDLKIISLEGRTVYTQKLSSAKTLHTIDVSSLTNGIYGVYLHNGVTVYSGKFLKTN
jgi:hypothetical protein